MKPSGHAFNFCHMIQKWTRLCWKVQTSGSMLNTRLWSASKGVIRTRTWSLAADLRRSDVFVVQTSEAVMDLQSRFSSFHDSKGWFKMKMKMKIGSVFSRFLLQSCRGGADFCRSSLISMNLLWQSEGSVARWGSTRVTGRWRLCF